MVCRPGKRVAFQDEGDADEDDSGEAEDIQYKDFFDPAEAPAAPRGLPQTSGSNAARCGARQPDSHLGIGLIVPGLGYSARLSAHMIHMLTVCFYEVMVLHPPITIELTLSADEGDEDDEEEGEEGDGGGAAGQLEGFLGEASVPATAAQEAQSLSAHERRMQRMAERAQRLEQQNVGEKEWFMRGEAGSGARLQHPEPSSQFIFLICVLAEAILNDLLSTSDLRSLLFTGARPLNSALEIDLDFERAVRPPPQPTEEVTASIEDLIRKRIADHQFDDVPRIAPPAPEKRRKTLDLSDQKSEKVGSFLPLAQELRAGRPLLRSSEDTIKFRSSGT